jgi:hypothetical protein
LELSFGAFVNITGGALLIDPTVRLIFDEESFVFNDVRKIDLSSSCYRMNAGER